MVVVTCPLATPVTDCEYATPDHEAAIVAVLLKHHLDTAHATPPPQPPVPPAHPVAPGGQTAGMKMQLDRPRIAAGSTTQDWDHFVRNWTNYKTLTRVAAEHVNTLLVECCEENLKNLMFGQYDAAGQTAASEADLLAAMKRLSVVHESVLTHRLRLHEAMQTPGQMIHAFLAILRKLARPCNFSAECKSGRLQ